MASKHALMLMPVLMLGACDLDPEVQQARDAEARLEKATAMISPSAMGTRHEQLTESAASFDEYRVKQLAAAAKEVQPIANSGRPAQQFAAHSLMAEAEAAAARYASRQAAEAWTAQSALAAQLISTASSLGSSALLATEQGKIDYDPQLAELNEQEKQAAATIEEAKASVATVQKRIDELNQQIATIEQRRNNAAAQAGDLARKAFQAEGQLRHDLTVQAADATRQADKASAQIEGLQSQLSVEQSRLALEEARLNNANALLEQLRQATADTQKRDQKAAEQAQAYRTRTQQLEQEFEAMFKQLAQQQESAVHQPMTAANQSYSQAITHLESALNVAPSDAREAAELTLATFHVEHAMELHKQAALHGSYAGLLNSLAKAAQQNLPQQATAVAEAAKAAAAKADEAKAAAVGELDTATQTLQQALDSASGQPEVERAVLRSLISAQRTRALLTGDAAAQQAVQQLQLRLQQLNAPPAAPAPTEPAPGAPTEPAPAPAPDAAPAPAPGGLPPATP